MIVALAVGWWVDRSKLAGEVETLEGREAIRAWTVNPVLHFELHNSQAPAPNPPKP